MSTEKAERASEKMLKHIAELIQKEVSYFNGWHVSDETERKNCRIAAAKIVKYLRRIGL